jgi:hypothetical protein
MLACDLPMPKKRGNPNWGKPAQSVPATSTEFERKLRELGLTNESCVSSVRLRNWCAANKNRCYIPEWWRQLQLLLRARRVKKPADGRDAISRDTYAPGVFLDGGLVRSEITQYTLSPVT